MLRKKPKKIYKLNWTKFLKKKERVKIPYRQVSGQVRGVMVSPSVAKA